MKKVLFFLFFTSLLNAQIEMGQDIDGDGIYDRFGRSTSISANGLTIATGAPIDNAGYVKVLTYNGANWILKGNKIFGTTSGEFFGESVSLSANGNILAVGSYSYDGGSGTNSGKVTVFNFNGSNWVQLGSILYGDNVNDYFGNKISLSSDGTILAIGSYENDFGGTDAGQVKVFNYFNNNWIQLGSNIYGSNADDRLGISVSLSSNGNILAVGAHTSDANGANSGQVKVFSYNGGNWIQKGGNINGEDIGDYFGGDVSLSSNGLILACGAIYNNGNANDSGHVRIYNFDGLNWIQLGADINGEANNDYSGVSVSLSSNGTIIGIGAYFNDGNGVDSGHFRMYNYSGDNWIQIGNDVNGEGAGDWFGTSLSLSSDGTTICVGGPKNSSAFTESGHVRVYNFSSLSIKNNLLSDIFSIYPNPVEDILTINLKEGLILKEINLYTEIGKLVKKENKNFMNVSELSTGLYFIEVITNTLKAAQKVIIK